MGIINIVKIYILLKYIADLINFFQSIDLSLN